MSHTCQFVVLPQTLRLILSRRLLDPSCSGSGIVNRLDYLISSDSQEEDKEKDGRLEKLAAFQLLMIKHAMTCESYIAVEITVG